MNKAKKQFAIQMAREELRKRLNEGRARLGLPVITEEELEQAVAQHMATVPGHATNWKTRRHLERVEGGYAIPLDEWSSRKPKSAWTPIADGVSGEPFTGEGRKQIIRWLPPGGTPISGGTPAPSQAAEDNDANADRLEQPAWRAYHRSLSELQGRLYLLVMAFEYKKRHEQEIRFDYAEWRRLTDEDWAEFAPDGGLVFPIASLGPLRIDEPLPLEGRDEVGRNNRLWAEELGRVVPGVTEMSVKKAKGQIIAKALEHKVDLPLPF
jgi:hypothetical protein